MHTSVVALQPQYEPDIAPGVKYLGCSYGVGKREFVWLAGLWRYGKDK
jgi:hypothetical protein